MRTLCLVLVGVVVGWAASGADGTRDAVGEDLSRGVVQENAESSAACAKEMLRAAQAALEATEVNYTHGNAALEDVCLWSRRAMKAALATGDTSAAAKHWKRMSALKEQVDAAARVGAECGDAASVAAAAYYAAEAMQTHQSFKGR